MFRISVIIPTFNRGTQLIRALDSVLAQTYPPLEIIVIDDGSTDDTANIVRKQYPSVTYQLQENQGVSSARNRGLEIASGDWIAFLDSDDAWLPEKLARQVASLQESPEYKICHTEEIWIRRGKRVNPRNKHQKYGGNIYEHCLPLCVISPSAVMIHQDIFRDIGNFDESLPACEDYDLWLRICAHYPVLFIEMPLIYKYGGHTDQLSAKHWGMDRFRIRALEKSINSDKLSESQLQAAVKMLLNKIEIFLTGAIKRDQKESILKYQQKKRHYKQIFGSFL